MIGSTILKILSKSMSKRRIVYISDFFSEDVLGGAELNDAELLHMLEKSGYGVLKVRSREVTLPFLETHKDCFFIVSNFSLLIPTCKRFLSDLSYVIYEHDHKYIRKRNPIFFKNFEVPLHKIINYYFYKNAKKVICQSDFHKNILQKNLKLENIISIGGNLWADKTLEKIKTLSRNKKNKKCSIVDSSIPHKNTQGAIQYCTKNNKDYELIKDQNYEKFLEKLSKNEEFIFLPKSPESFSRVVIEARMLGCKVIANQMIGASQEDWFKLKGEDLIDYMIEKKSKIFKTILEIVEDKNIQEQKPLVSIISTFYKGEEFLEGLLEDITSQTIFDKCELILIDTASPGKEKEIVEKYTDKFPNIRYYRFEERTNPTVGTNIGLLKASAHYVTIANIDDRRSKKFLQNTLECITNDKNAHLVYSNCVETEKANEKFSDNSLNGNLFEHSLLPFSKENMIKCLPGPMPFWDTMINEESGFFDESYKFANDWEMWLRAVNNGFRFKKNNEILGLYLKGGRSDAGLNIDQRKEEAEIFFKFQHIFGSNRNKYYQYFNQFRRM